MHRPPMGAKRTTARGWVAAGPGLLALLLVAIPLAAPGPGLVPGAGTDQPRWILGLYGDGLGVGAGVYLGLLYAATLAWVVVWLGAERLGRRTLRLAVGFLLALFALAPPLLSLDIFSYIAYGQLGVEGLNPYEFVPADLPGDAAASRVDDFRFTPSVYGPLFTLITYPLAAIGAGFALWSLKAIALASVLALGAMTARLARVRGVDPTAATAFVVLNPLILVHVVGGAHNDGLMVALALAAAVSTVGARPVGAGMGIVAAISVKVSGALYLPFLVVGSPARGRLLLGVFATAAAVVAGALAYFGPSVAEALSVASGNQDTVSRWSVPGTISRISGIDLNLLRAIFAVGYGITVAGLLGWVFAGADWIRAAGWAALGLLVATSWMVPWYIVWLLPLAAVARDRPLAAGAITMTAFQCVNAVPL